VRSAHLLHARGTSTLDYSYLFHAGAVPCSLQSRPTPNPDEGQEAISPPGVSRHLSSALRVIDGWESTFRPAAVKSKANSVEKLKIHLFILRYAAQGPRDEKYPVNGRPGLYNSTLPFRVKGCSPPRR
jgi:hypothetical protein